MHIHARMRPARFYGIAVHANALAQSLWHSILHGLKPMRNRCVWRIRMQVYTCSTGHSIRYYGVEGAYAVDACQGYVRIYSTEYGTLIIDPINVHWKPIVRHGPIEYVNIASWQLDVI